MVEYNNEDGTITVELNARKQMYEDATAELPSEVVDRQLAHALRQQLSEIYDSREELKQQLK